MKLTVEIDEQASGPVDYIKAGSAIVKGLNEAGIYGILVQRADFVYEIVEGESHGTKWWTVLQMQDIGADRRILGGDRHWLNREFAETAKRQYEAGTADHGHVNNVRIGRVGQQTIRP